MRAEAASIFSGTLGRVGQDVEADAGERGIHADQPGTDPPVGVLRSEALSPVSARQQDGH